MKERTKCNNYIYNNLKKKYVQSKRICDARIDARIFGLGWLININTNKKYILLYVFVLYVFVSLNTTDITSKLFSYLE